MILHDVSSNLRFTRTVAFHQVGIRRVRVMSAKVFEDLQAQYRNELRLTSQRTELQTDRRIAAEQNNVREETEMERLRGRP